MYPKQKIQKNPGLHYNVLSMFYIICYLVNRCLPFLSIFLQILSTTPVAISLRSRCLLKPLNTVLCVKKIYIFFFFWTRLLWHYNLLFVLFNDWQEVDCGFIMLSNELNWHEMVIGTEGSIRRRDFMILKEKE